MNSQPAANHLMHNLPLGWLELQNATKPVGYPFDFDPVAGIETVIYIAARVSEPFLHKVLTILYFADRLHLEQFGRLISGDHYIAMKNGPIASATFDLLGAARNGYTTHGFTVQNELVIPLRQANVLELSRSDVDCLDQAIAQYGQLGQAQLIKASQDLTWNAADSDNAIHLEQLVLGMEIKDALLDYVRNQHG
jgi:hypothetical protein